MAVRQIVPVQLLSWLTSGCFKCFVYACVIIWFITSMSG